MIADYFATVPAVEEEDAVDGENESNQDDTEMVSESRRGREKPRTEIQKKTVILDQAVGALTIQEDDLDDEGLVTTLCHRFKLTFGIT